MRFDSRRGAFVLLVLALGFADDVRASTRTVTAARVDTAPQIDGFLQDPAWATALPTADFVQQRPATGELSTATTTVRLLYDADALYVGFVCAEPDPAGVLRRSLARDSDFSDEDSFTFVLDTYDDSQSAFVFRVNPNGARTDLLARNEGEFLNEDWDGIWSTVTRVTEDGWQGEIRIPWRTLRFPRSDAIEMGVNFERQRRAVNEQSHWAAVPREFSVYRVSLAGTLVGLRAIDPGRNVIVRPYALVRSERGDTRMSDAYGPDSWDHDAEVGLDAKVAVTPSVTLDLTVNTDFAQVEIDDEIVNVTRFGVDLPEKREFFLEQANLFRFGSPSNLLFRSRSIGLDERGRQYPIHYGARLTGRLGTTEFGALGMEQGRAHGAPTRRFGVVRVRQDVSPRSSVGVLAVTRQSSDDGDFEEADHYALGLDADLNPTDELLLSLYSAVTEADGQGDDDASWGGRARWTHPLYQLIYLHQSIGRDYEPVVGFLERGGVEIDAAGVAFTPEPGLPWLRRMENDATVYWIDQRGGPFESRYLFLSSVLVTPSEERLGVYWERDFDRLFGPGFGLDEDADGVADIVFDGGDYTYDYVGWEASTDPSHWWSVDASGVVGELFDADRTNVRVGADLRFAPHLQIGIETVSERIRRGNQGFDSDLVRLRTRYAFDTQFTIDVFAQYDSADRLSVSQLRARWIFGDESDLYVVFEDARDADLTTGVKRFDWDFGDRRSASATLKVSYARAI